jgi:LacI family transcriptional regulator, galactose operon repressor
MRNATIADVARAADVSTGTVSHVLSGARNVRPQTRERVERAIAELGYRPSTIARALTSRRTRTVGMVVPDVTNPFFTDLIWQVERALTDADYALIFGSSANDPQRERRYLEGLLQRRVDAAVLVVTADADESLLRRIAEEIPTVHVDRAVGATDAVVGDNAAGTAAAVDHLVALGHRRIALVNGDERLPTALERRAGFDAALARNGLAPAAHAAGPFTLESGHRLMLDVLGHEPTAVLAGNDLIAMGILNAAADRGVGVPGELSVVGYDDIAYAAFTSPPLTTVRQPGGEMGTETARLLLSRLDGHDGGPRRVIVHPELVVRGSTGRA